MGERRPWLKKKAIYIGKQFTTYNTLPQAGNSHPLPFPIKVLGRRHYMHLGPRGGQNGVSTTKIQIVTIVLVPNDEVLGGFPVTS